MAATKAGKVTDLELSRIIRDPEIQPREEMNQDTVVQYSEDMLAGIEFPPGVVYHDQANDQYWLSQGFHRSEGAKAAGFSTMLVEIRKGTRQDAMWDAAGSNREHDKSGLRRSNADKRRAVKIALLARPKAPENQLAGHLGVAQSFVNKIRKELASYLGDKINPPEREVTRNGTTYTMQTGNIGQRAASPVAEKAEDGDHGAEETDEEEGESGAGIEEETDNEADEEEPSEESDEPEELFQLTPQSISSEVKPASRPTFNATNEMVDWARWTWNPVTGCEHNCVYCVSGDTLVTLADGSARPISDIKVGDLIIGVEKHGYYWRYTETSVLAHWRTVKPAYRVTLANGVSVTCSGDHRWLTNRQDWKYTRDDPTGRFGVGRGQGQRPHLEPGNKLMGYGVMEPNRHPTDDYKAGYITATIRGDGTMGIYRDRRRESSYVYSFRLAALDVEMVDRTQRYMSDLGVGDVSRFGFKMAAGDETAPAIRSSSRATYEAVSRLIIERDTDEWRRGFVAGAVDAEGNNTGTGTISTLRIFNSDLTYLAVIERWLSDHRFAFTYDTDRQPANKTVRTLRVTGGLSEHLRLFQMVDPSIRRKCKLAGCAVKHSNDLRIVSIEPLGFDLPMFDITTGTENFVANGLVSHNCYARDIANRFYPEKFTPTFRPERLNAPRDTSRPHAADAETDPVKAMSWRNVFVCSMADLFGRWVPDQWIEDVFASCRKSPEWNYLFLTKFPQRYVGLHFPETAWVGTSVDEQKRVANAEKAFAKIEVPVRWLSVEPMRERIVFHDLSMFDWVVIGGQSRSSEAPEFHPEPWWVIDLAWKAREAGCKVYLKPNTFRDMGWQIKEYPY
jgi:protein gp37